MKLTFKKSYELIQRKETILIQTIRNAVMKEAIFELGLEKNKILVIDRNGEKGDFYSRMTK